MHLHLLLAAFVGLVFGLAICAPCRGLLEGVLSGFVAGVFGGLIGFLFTGNANLGLSILAGGTVGGVIVALLPSTNRLKRYLILGDTASGGLSIVPATSKDDLPMAFWKEYGHVSGISSVGLGDDHLHVVVVDEASRAQLPDSFRGLMVTVAVAASQPGH